VSWRETAQTRDDLAFIARFLLTPDGHHSPQDFERLDELAKRAEQENQPLLERRLREIGRDG
jgi:hypothetical protein